MKRGQITLVLIIVVGLLILFFFLFSVRNKFINKPDKAVEDKAVAVRTFVEECLYKSALNGLNLIGRQGGVIYKSQGGLTSDYFRNGNYSIHYNNYDVLFSILAGGVAYGRSCSPKDIGKPRYKFDACPSISFPFKGLRDPEISFKETDSDVPPIDNIRLFNRLVLPGLYPKEGVYVDKEMQETNELAGARNKIFNSFAHFIKINISGCLNYSKLKKRDYLVMESGNISVEPVFAEDFTQVNLNMPLTVKNLATGHIIHLNKFTARVPVRFGKIYKYVRDILYREAKDFNFNLTNVTKKEYDGIIMRLEKDYYKKIDIVNFTDKKSVYPTHDGVRYYTFTGAIPNSAPAISYFFSNISDAFVPGLKNALLNCPQFPHHNPFEMQEDKLMIKLGGRMNRDTVECLFWAYNETFGYQKWKPAYDADDDHLRWSFRTKTTDWNQEAIFSGRNIVFNNMIELNFSDGMYYDIEKIPLMLKNHQPVIKNLIFDSAIAGTLKYELVVEDVDAVLGDNVDVLTLTASGDNSIIRYMPQTSARVLNRGNNFYWPISMLNSTGHYYLTFTVTDKYGLRDEKSFEVTIP